MRVTLHRCCALLLLLAVAARAADPLPDAVPDAAPEPASEPAPQVPAEPPAGPPADEESQAGADTTGDYNACDQPGSTGPGVIDRMQRGVYAGVCGTAQWFDGLFGTPRFDQDTDETFGRLGVYERYDRRDGLDTRLRLRARLALPALSDRVQLTLGRGNEQQLVEERPANSDAPLPADFQNTDDDAFLLGLGYSKDSRLSNGFDFGIGVRLRFPPDPYVKTTYRHNWILSDDTMLRFRETPFWRDSRGFGATTQISLDHLATPTVLLRWSNAATIAEDTEGFEWGADFTAFQGLSRRRGLSYTALLRGETRADVGIQNYGVELRYRQRILRDWLFVGLSGSLTWPRETLLEKREINPGVGLGFEMYFGPVPAGQMY